MLTYAYIHTYIHSYILTYIHTIIHAYIPTDSQPAIAPDPRAWLAICRLNINVDIDINPNGMKMHEREVDRIIFPLHYTPVMTRQILNIGEKKQKKKKHKSLETTR